MLVSIFAILAIVLAIEPTSATNSGVPVNSASKYKFAVRLILKYTRPKGDNFYGCGGVIFSPSVVLTAAHCLYHKDEKLTAIKVIAGKTNYGASSPLEQEVMVKSYRIHKDYKIKITHLCSTNEYRVNDIGILWLKASFMESPTVKQAIFASNSFTTKIKGTALGFGPVGTKSNERQLYEVELKAISYNTCKNVKKHYIGPNTFCAMPVSDQNSRSTKGDSGSAFMYDGKVLGLVSFGSVDDNGDVCKNMPIVMTDITKHAATIAQYLREGPPNKICSKPQGKSCALS